MLSESLRGYKAELCASAVRSRVAASGVRCLADYLERLRAEPAEQEALRRSVLVGATRFFRDPAAFETLKQQVFVPHLTEGDPGRELRVWVVGCSTGEEVYSLLMAAYEVAEEVGRPLALKILATDADESALAQTRRALYPHSVRAQVSEARLARFFVPHAEGFRVTRALRRHVLFAAHDVRSSMPFVNIDLVSCQNVLIYLEPEWQQRVLRTLVSSLAPGGRLLLASSESIGACASYVRQIEPAAKLYARRDDEPHSGHVSGVVTRTTLISRARVAAPTESDLVCQELSASSRQAELLRAAVAVLLANASRACLLVDDVLRVIVTGDLCKHGFPPCFAGQTLAFFADALGVPSLPRDVDAAMHGSRMVTTLAVVADAISLRVYVTPVLDSDDRSVRGAWIELERERYDHGGARPSER